MTDAELTIKSAIFLAIVDNAPITNDKAEKIKDDVFNALIDSATIWALAEILEENSKNT